MNENQDTQPVDDQPIAVINRSPTQQIQVRLNEFKGKKYIDLRTYYLDENEEVYKPTKKGISIPVELFEELKATLAKVEALL